MSDDQDMPVQEVELEITELDSLKETANTMGIKFHPSIGLDTLKAKIEAHRNERPIVTHSIPTPEKAPQLTAVPDSKKGRQMSSREKIRLDAIRLVRIRVTCMNPNKREWQGEVLSARNRYTGTVKKFIPFNADQGWHVPYILYQFIKDKKCQVFINTKDSNGRSTKTPKLVNEYSVEVLPELTRQELKDLGLKQARTGAIQNV